MCVSGVSFLFYLFSFLSLHQKHGVPCFWCFFLFIFFLCTPGTCICMFRWFIYILCTLGHALYACLQGFFLLFYFFFFFAPQQPVLTSRHVLRTPRHVFQTPSSQAPKRTYEQLYVRFFFCLFFLALETHVRAVVHAFLMFLFISFYFIPPETHV
jgi:hypothetical protein